MIVVFVSEKVCAQLLNYPPPSSHNIQLTPILTNPSYKIDGRGGLVTNFHSYLGLFADVNYTNLTGVVNINAKRALGASLLYESTSDFFTRSRLHVIYQEHIELNNDTWLSMAAKFGMINFNMSALGGTAGGSDWAPDLTVGLSLRSREFRAGFSLEQITNPSIRPMEYTFELKRIMEVNGSYQIDLSSIVKYVPELRVRMSQGYNQIRWNNLIEFYEKAGVGFSYIFETGSLINLFYKHQNKGADRYQFFMSYLVPSGSLENIDAAQIELGAVFYFVEKSD